MRRDVSYSFASGPGQVENLNCLEMLKWKVSHVYGKLGHRLAGMWDVEWMGGSERAIGQGIQVPWMCLHWVIPETLI